MTTTTRKVSMRGISCQLVLGMFTMLLTSGLATPGQGNEAITCHTSEAVVEGGDAKITCDFHRNLKGTNDTFFIHRLSSTNETQIMSLCEWKDKHPQCKYFDRTVLETADENGTISFKIPMVQTNESGKYVCKIKSLPDADENVMAYPCTLNVQKSSEGSCSTVFCFTNSPVQLGRDATIVCASWRSFQSSSFGLKKYTGDSEGSYEDIVICTKDTGCIVKKRGVQIAIFADTFLRINILAITKEDEGVYFFHCDGKPRFFFSLEIQSAEKPEEPQLKIDMKELLVPFYLIFTLLVLLLLLLGSFAIRKRVSSCFSQDKA